MNKLQNGPIFIGGDNRSGTTLLSTILDSHSELVIGPELDFMQPINLGSYISLCCNLLLDHDPRVVDKGVEAATGFKYGVQFVKQCHRFGIGFADLRDLVEGMVRKHGEPIEFEQRLEVINRLGEQRTTATNSARWGIKIQTDIVKVEHYLEFWPEAQFIHLIRDGRDVAASHLSNSNIFPYKNIEQAAKGWSSILHVMAGYKDDPSIFELKYESLVQHTTDQLRDLVAFLNIAWQDSFLNHAALDHTLFNNPYLHPSVEKVKKRINSASIGRYKKDLTQEQLVQFQVIAGAQLQAHGYQ